MKPRALSCLAALALLTSGCIRQRLVIKSDPPGAEVILNDQRAGSTPYEALFSWYGWYRVTLIKPGYDQLDDRVLLRTPLKLWLPLDLAMELAPWSVKDTKELAYRLVPAKTLPEPQPPQDVELMEGPSKRPASTGGT